MSMTRVTTQCPECGKTWDYEVDTQDYCQFLQGAEPGEVFHYLSVDEIIQLIHGVCDDCIHSYGGDIGDYADATGCEV